MESTGQTGSARVTIEGLWTGTTSDQRPFALVVLDDGQFWGLYGLPNASLAGGIGGAIEGAMTQDTDAETFASSPISVDFSSEGFARKIFNAEGWYVPMATLWDMLY